MIQHKSSQAKSSQVAFIYKVTIVINNKK